jgi:hypothetical protein
MTMTWVRLVLRKKGMREEAINRVTNLYADGISIVVVNNILGRVVKNNRMSIRQGDKASMEWFTYGVDPIITYLERRLQGILIHALPILGPLPPPPAPPLLPQEERYKIIAYCDDLKPAITTMDEFILVDHGMTMFERSSGCRMHRDPTSGKCKFLPLGRWKGTLTQEDLPCNFFTLSDHLDMLGVILKSTYTATRKANGDEIQERIRNIVGPWRAGRFMPLTMRPHSLNTYALSAMWHKCNVLDLRVGDITAINKSCKSWLYADMLEKPSELALHRKTEEGGLGLISVQLRSLASQINCFLETACRERFRRNLYHQSLLNHYVTNSGILGLTKPAIPPYFRGKFFPTIRRIHSSPLNLAMVGLKEIYKFLLDDLIMTEEGEGGEEEEGEEGGLRNLKPLRCEMIDPNVNWERSWRRGRLRPLSPNLCSFLFLLLQQLLPTAERVARILPNSSTTCTRCFVRAGNGEEERKEVETLLHAFFNCEANNRVGQVLVTSLRQYIPSITPLQLLTLDFETEDSLEFPLVWVIASSLSSLWAARKERRRVELYNIRSELEASCALLRKTSFTNEETRTDVILSLLTNM